MQTPFSDWRSRKPWLVFSFLLILIVIGRAIVSNFQETWKIVNIDLKPNTQAHSNILLSEKQDISDNLSDIYADLEKVSKQYESIMCVAGGWMGGSIKDKAIFTQYKTSQQMHVVPSLLGNLLLIFIELF